MRVICGIGTKKGRVAEATLPSVTYLLLLLLDPSFDHLLFFSQFMYTSINAVAIPYTIRNKPAPKNMNKTASPS
jgi:hypothetical protein